MNKFRLLLITMCLIILGACSENDDFSEVQVDQSQSRKITISVSIDSEKGSITRAGIVEGNTDYNSGEEFYWSEGDQINLYFIKSDGTYQTIPSSIFSAGNIDGNKADFTGEIPEGLTGEYDIYASKGLEQVSSSSTQLKYSLQQITNQKGTSSKGIAMPMLSTPIRGVEIVNGEIDNISSLKFSLKQLNSLLRFTIENNSTQAMTVEKIAIWVEDESGETIEAFNDGATVDMTSSADTKWSNINSSLVDQLTLAVEQLNEAATIATGDVFDAYLPVLPSNGFEEGNNFVIEIIFKGADGENYMRKGKIEISDNGNYAFLSTGLKAEMRYYFTTNLTTENLPKISLVTFEDEPSSSYWSSLIDSPQYGGPLLYGDYTGVDYEWTDDKSGLYSTLGGEYGKVYWSGGIAVSNYASEDMEANGSHEEQLTVYGTGGNNGSKNFAVSFGYLDDSGFTSAEWQPKMSFSDGVAKTIDHMYIAPTTYFYNVVVNGNPLSPAVGDDDVWITATGYLNDIEGETVTNYYVKGGISLINTWTKWNLSGLGKVDKVVFNIGGGTDNGYGFSLPAYIAMDDIMIIHN